MRKLCVRMEDDDFVLIENAGHWVQQESASAVVNSLIRFLGKFTS
jgi:pimeloyl-ACP methyl ester carboxylesterase